ncbi:hypothetical protein B0H10DRAFT_1651740, partial [Mycena sp. CBHHK59/15]
TATIGASWTRRLAMHPVATVLTAIVLCLACAKHKLAPCLTSLASFAALFMMVAVIIDIAFYADVHHQVGKITGGKASTTMWPAIHMLLTFWMTFVSLIFLLLAGCAVCFGHRKQRTNTLSSYPMS